MGSDAWLVVGLGNTGRKYEGNRHNVGRMVVDLLARRAGASLARHPSQTYLADVRLGVGPGGVPGPRAILARTNGYMNVSGGPVKALAAYYGIAPERLLVVHDELDLPVWTLRLKRGGGEGGHNGLRSISGALGTRDYLRLRFGVGRPPGRQDPADYVLSDFSAAEQPELALQLELAADAIEDVAVRGLELAQMRLHAAP
ncbi:aminoacyl-tRNA hydrolase [Buchananella hordeovulneris]|uniref:aminoacyl-tRNA hydrolase n=1 Tax=Buchananella hordeovulneris TaxID=52770 RepID=UPI000F5ED7F9|nr:aminoacyl-tRNA hydrolase [Buchananella hordeovulneris]RRD43802.1 aminoacyl-tRNA hydrolase [Buchananella hordeovulneris]